MIQSFKKMKMVSFIVELLIEKKTNVKVFCSPMESNGVRKPDGVWSSTDYWSK